MKQFQNLGLNETVCRALEEELGIETPTECQHETIPRLLDTETEDVVIKAKTGAGKTLSFLAPIISQLLGYEPALSPADKRKTGTHAIVLCPTRELALQTHTLCQKILSKARPHWITAYLLFGSSSFSNETENSGGRTRQKEKAALRKGQTIVVATPGRLLDHLETTASFLLTSLRWFVLDEADRLVDLGFGQKIRKIFSTARTKQQQKKRPKVLLCSATIEKDTKEFGGIVLRSPCYVGESVSSSEGVAIPDSIVQEHALIKENDRLSFFLCFVSDFFTQNTDSGKVAVFFSSCVSVDFHFELLKQFLGGALTATSEECLRDVLCFKLHGGVIQDARTKTYGEFCAAKRGILLCTDVAARGVDIPDITAVLQCDAPMEENDYLHRAGRTGRGDKRGRSVLVLMDGEKGYLSVLEKKGMRLRKHPTAKMVERVLGENTIDTLTTRLTDVVSSDSVLCGLGEKSVLSFLRAYATHKPALKAVFHRKRLHLGGLAEGFGLKKGIKTVQEIQREGKRTGSAGKGEGSTGKRRLKRNRK
ncbi:MAG: DEAD-box ATP-dependent RNA helicase [Amphiamblys sp. WSBS2006]|nr:MAG: DEAD-box ATP-dependent RNA helicase [Amphiamblys sp. WSBS2006]